MIKVALGYFIGACILFLLVVSLTLGINYAIVNNRLVPERVSLHNFCVGAFVFLMVAVPILVIIFSYKINRLWRTIVEEDLSQQKSTDQTVAAKDSLRSVYLWGGIAIFAFLLVFVFLWIPMDAPLEFLCIIPTIVLVFGIALFYYVVRISKDQTCIEKYPPRLPNLLSLLTGDEKAPRCFRNRINFWGDLTGIGWGLFFTHIVLIGTYFQNYGSGLAPIELFGVPLGNGRVLLFSLILLVYFLFIVFFAGIPRRRYWGMIFLGVSVFLINCVVHLMMISKSLYECLRLDEKINLPLYLRLESLSLQWSYRLIPFQLSFHEFMMIYGLLAWYLLCFVLLGVAGLWAFRKRS
jgi:hypothetical protein